MRIPYPHDLSAVSFSSSLLDTQRYPAKNMEKIRYGSTYAGLPSDPSKRPSISVCHQPGAVGAPPPAYGPIKPGTEKFPARPYRIINPADTREKRKRFFQSFSWLKMSTRSRKKR